MYGGNSGCFGIVVYNTDIKGNNAVYGYYIEDEMHFETGTREDMREFRDRQEKEQSVKAGKTGKRLVVMFFVYLAFVIAGFVAMPLRCAFALMVFCVLSYIPVMIIFEANDRLFKEDSMQEAFCRHHGVEHAVISALTDGKDCTMEVLQNERIYDPECGTAYAGYAVTIAFVLAMLIVFWPGVLKALLVLLATAAVLLVMILKPAINPFTLIQHKVVKRPTQREYQLGLEIMKKVKELQHGKVLL